MGSLAQGFSSGGGIGLLGSISSGMSSYYGAQAQGIAAQGQYQALQGQSNAEAAQALLQASSMSNQYKIGALNMIMQAQAEKASYDAAAAKYQIEQEGKKGQAAVYEAESATKLLEKSYTMRNASILGASALDVVRQGAEVEAKLREEGQKFRGTQRASIAAGGTDVASGTALDILRETDEGIESDAAALRMTAQKNRWQLLMQQQNMWMVAEIRELESDNYKAAAEGMVRSADMSGKAAGIMEQLGAMSLKSGDAGAEAYRALAEIAIQSGQITAKDYKAQGAMYSQLGNIARDAANAQAIGGLLGTLAPAVGTFMSNRQQSQPAAMPTASYGGLPEINDSWDAMSFGMGLDTDIKINEAALGQFLPSKDTKRVDSYGEGFLYSPKKWGLV